MKCPCRNGVHDVTEMSVPDIQQELNSLLYNEEVQKACGAKARALLSIVILKEKAHKFDFLKGGTEWKVIGKWKPDGNGHHDIMIEKNVQVDIEFKDHACIGGRVIELLKEYNRKEVGEQLLYARTMPVEEGTL